MRAKITPSFILCAGERVYPDPHAFVFGKFFADEANPRCSCGSLLNQTATVLSHDHSWHSVVRCSACGTDYPVLH